MRLHTTSLALIIVCAVSACVQNGPVGLTMADTPALSEPTAAPPAGQHRPHAGMLRYPDVSASRVAFVYANDIWTVARTGGVATRLASPPGQESFPRFSPDGQRIAFVGNYDGNRDLYTIPVGGGIAHRVTFHPAREVLCDWSGGDRLLYFSNGLAGLRRQQQLFQTEAQGGLPERLPVPYGANGAVSADGTWLAYTPHSRDTRTWKRYRGGMATDIWLFNLNDHTSKKITDWEGTDTLPMWFGDTVYYLSDAGPKHRLNIWSYDTQGGKRKQITFAAAYDVKWPSIGPGPAGGGEIVFQNGPELQLLDLTTGRVATVEVVIPGDRPKIRRKIVDVSDRMVGADVSPTGKRAVVEARGDIWTLPAKKGSPRNLTRSSGVAERDPSWSPDGQWIAYFSDETGEYELYIMQSDGKEAPQQLTRDGKVFRYNPVWSPDSKRIAYSDKTGALYLYDIDARQSRRLDRHPWANPVRVKWSHDSNWIAYTKALDNRVSSIWLYDVAAGEKHQVTAGMFNDSGPTFDRKGAYLFFASNRNFTAPVYEDVGTTFVYSDTDMLFVVGLRDDIASPWAPKSDEEEWGDDADGDIDDDAKEKDDDAGKKNDAAKGKGEAQAQAEAKSKDKDKGEDESDDAKKDDGEKDDEIEPVNIDLDGFERRAIPLPVKRGRFGPLAVNNDGKLIYTRRPRRGSEGKPSIKLFDLDNDEKKEETVLKDVGNFTISADGKKLLVRKGGKTLAIIDAAKDQKLDKKKISLSGMNATIDPRAEWRQVFTEAWRIERDFFYDPNMHGVDWPAVREQYGAMLADCASREDVTFVIGEMIAEINVGHTYVRPGGDREKQPRVGVGMLGCDYARENGAYRITRIHEGAPWDYDARGPLSEPHVDVNEGDYLLAVNGVALDTTKAPWAAFLGLADRVATITVSDKPVLDEDARDVVVKPIGSESTLRYRAWVEHNRAYVEAQTDGRVGYIYVPNTGIQGQNELIRQFYGQVNKAALIIDERWNGGGQIPTRFIEMLNRPVANYWARRDGNDWPWPPDAHFGPKCMLINGLAGSGGDYFPFYFKDRKLGKLIGMRTWGGLVGYSGNPGLIDGGGVTAPTFAFYETDGTWGIEGHGVDPDLEVIDDPALMTDGGDPQLDAAIAHMLQEIKRNGYAPPPRPAYPDRHGMGIKEADK